MSDDNSYEIQNIWDAINDMQNRINVLEEQNIFLISRILYKNSFFLAKSGKTNIDQVSEEDIDEYKEIIYGGNYNLDLVFSYNLDLAFSFEKDNIFSSISYKQLDNETVRNINQKIIRTRELFIKDENTSLIIQASSHKEVLNITVNSNGFILQRNNDKVECKTNLVLALKEMEDKKNKKNNTPSI